MRKALLTAIGMLPLLAGQGAHAQSSKAADDDLRCIAIVSVALSQAEEDKKASMIAGVMYFVGRLDSEAPNADLATEMKRVVSGMTQEEAVAHGKRCSAILIERGHALQTVGDALRSSAPAAEQPKK